MSEVGRLSPTVGGDAPVVETVKTDDIINPILQSTECEPVYVDVTSGNATASRKSEEVEEVGASTETKHLMEMCLSGNTFEKAADSSNGQSKIVNLIAEDASVVQVDTQMSGVEVDDSTASILQGDEAPQKSVNEEKVDNSMQNALEGGRDNDAMCVSKLEAELLVRKSLGAADRSERNGSFHELDNAERTEERNVYRKKLEDTEAKLAALQASYDTITNHEDDENTLQQSVEQLHGQLVQTALMYEERNRMVANQENQINALNNQVASLKEVVSITRDLLQIRNMEVKQLQAEVDNMEKKISEERDRHNAMINKMDTAMRLNADLKKEYETQLSLFHSLREKYGEKITLLTAEKQALDTTASTSE